MTFHGMLCQAGRDEETLEEEKKVAKTANNKRSRPRKTLKMVKGRFQQLEMGMIYQAWERKKTKTLLVDEAVVPVIERQVEVEKQRFRRKIEKYEAELAALEATYQMSTDDFLAPVSSGGVGG